MPGAGERFLLPFHAWQLISSAPPGIMPLEISTMPGLQLTGRHKLKLVGEPILTYITGDPSTLKLE